jgi:hypothetical protein
MLDNKFDSNSYNPNFDNNEQITNSTNNSKIWEPKIALGEQIPTKNWICTNCRSPIKTDLICTKCYHNFCYNCGARLR